MRVNLVVDHVTVQKGWELLGIYFGASVCCFAPAVACRIQLPAIRVAIILDGREFQLFGFVGCSLWNNSRRKRYTVGGVNNLENSFGSVAAGVQKGYGFHAGDSPQ